MLLLFNLKINLGYAFILPYFFIVFFLLSDYNLTYAENIVIKEESDGIFHTNLEVTEKSIQSLNKEKYNKNDKDKIEVMNFEEFFGIEKKVEIIERKGKKVDFNNNKVPNQLFNRFFNDDNKHHPTIITLEEKYKLMFLAIEEERTNDFRALISSVSDLNVRDLVTGETLLTYAGRKKNYSAIASLVSRGVDINSVNQNNETIVNIAIDRDDKNLLKFLINMGADLSQQNHRYQNYLIHAIKFNSFSTAKLLIDNKIEFNKLQIKNFINNMKKKNITAKYVAFQLLD